MRKLKTLTLLFLFLFTKTAISCSGFKLTIDNQTMVGLSEDYLNPNTIISTKKATINSFGVIFFGYSETGMDRQSAINDKGLVFDSFAIDEERKTKSQKGVKVDGDIAYQLNEDIMTSCSNVNDVIKLLSKYSLEDMGSQWFFADKDGNSIIVEADTIIKGDKNYQIVTNYNQSQVNSKNPITCKRYIGANNILSNKQEFTKEYGLQLIKAMYQTPSCYATQYSQLFDLSKGKLYLFLFHNYEEEVEFDIASLLNQDLKWVPIQSYFKNKSNYLLELSNYTTTIRITSKMNYLTDKETMTKYIDSIMSLPFYCTELFRDTILNIGIYHARNNQNEIAQLIAEKYTYYKLEVFSISEYLLAYVDYNNKKYSTAKMHIDFSLTRRPADQNYLSLEAAIKQRKQNK